jgi:hypothetical protein
MLVQVPLPDIMDQHAKSFKSPDQAFTPRILKTKAQSRLRDLRVYHPPSKRSQPQECGKQKVRRKHTCIYLVRVWLFGKTKGSALLTKKPTVGP